jgi:Ser/Thr protein kinase RdoA (MazF antagonist)
VAEANGLEIRSVELIGGYANTIFKLEPLPLVARVANGSFEFRQGPDWMEREIAVAQHLQTVSGRSVCPAKLMPPGPYLCGQYHLTFWDHVQVTPQPVTPAELGKELRALHILLEGCRVTLPELEALNIAWRIFEHPFLFEKLNTAQKETISRKCDQLRNALANWSLESRPLHGDAHHGNLWSTANGPVWGDFEDTHQGPLEWDLACMITSSRVFGKGKAESAALDAYDASFDRDLLDLLVEGRTLQAVAWALAVLPKPSASQRVQKRLKWLER